MSSKIKLIGTSRSIRAGITFPVGRIHSVLKKGHYAQRISVSAPVHLAAALQYLSLEILELAVEAARAGKKNRLVPRHILFAVRRDDELSKLLEGVVISEAGVLPSIQPQLLPKKAPKSTE